MLLLLLGCVDDLCARFNLDCEVESVTIVPGVDEDGDLWSASEDCDDANVAINPGSDEVCDNRDNDCDGESDEDSAVGAAVWYPDADGDGFGAGPGGQAACDPPADTAKNAEDCDDGDPERSPAAAEVCDDQADNDCDPATACGNPEGPVQAGDLSVGARGSEAGDGAGAALASAGDLDGDGKAELLVGAPGEGGRGAAYLVQAASLLKEPSSFADERDGLRGAAERGRLGAAVDGAADGGALTALVGAPGAGGLVEGAGSAVALWGAAGEHPLSEAAGGLFRGDEAGDLAGAAVRLVGDYDGDGESDALVGAPGRGEGAGAAWLLHGPLSGALEENASLIGGEATGDAAGSALLAADVDGSGLADLLVGAPGGGALYLLRDGEIPASLADAERFRGDEGSGLGASLAAADLDSDGLPEILVGAPGGGYAAALRGDLVELWRCSSVKEGDGAGAAVAAGGDLDGDGIGDLIIGAPLAEGGGAAYVLYGPLGGGCVLQGDAAFGVHGGRRLGAAVLGGGQVDGVGYADVVLGDPGAEGGEQAGAVYVVLTHGL